MSDQYGSDSLLDVFIFESSQLIEQLEQSILESEKSGGYDEDSINEIFRIMHTIKGSSAMMSFQNISMLAHSLEELFFFLREEKPKKVDGSALSDLVLEGVDYIKIEVEKIRNGDEADGDATETIDRIRDHLAKLKRQNGSSPAAKETKKDKKAADKADGTGENEGELSAGAEMEYRYTYSAVIFFEDGCEMENIRAYAVIHSLKEIAEVVSYTPEDIIDNDATVEKIRQNGFHIKMQSNLEYRDMNDYLMKTMFLRDMELIRAEKKPGQQEQEPDESVQPQLQEDRDKAPAAAESPTTAADTGQVKKDKAQDRETHSAGQSIISVSVSKLDNLMDLVGEMVIAEAMVIQNPDLQGLQLESFQKAARQLGKIIGEIQDMVMAIRMVPLSATFHKMHRIVRDMTKKLDKDVNLEISGEETEVDKNIIEHISDPLMHLVRNSLDHGIESAEERIAAGKPPKGTITLEAKNAGSDVLIIVRDDGKGLNKEKVLKKAQDNGLLTKLPEEMTDKEIFSLIFLPGFSTKESVTEFSGRGVGMDVVTKNLETIGGSVSVDSAAGQGTIVTCKIPLTLAIIDGMNIKVGSSRYTIPIISIRESFKPKPENVITDPAGNEMIMVRGKCYPILRLHDVYGVETDITEFTDGIFVMVEQDDKNLCVFADELLGQQQVVVKALPEYIKTYRRIKGLSGCTLLGDGSISLILDVAGLIGR